MRPTIWYFTRSNIWQIIRRKKISRFRKPDYLCLRITTKMLSTNHMACCIQVPKSAPKRLVSITSGLICREYVHLYDSRANFIFTPTAPGIFGLQEVSIQNIHADVVWSLSPSCGFTRILTWLDHCNLWRPRHRSLLENRHTPLIRTHMRQQPQNVLECACEGASARFPANQYCESSLTDQSDRGSDLYI